MKKNQKRPQFAKRKRAFDETLAAYRNARDYTGGLGAISISDLGKPAKNLAKPSLTDFRCDVEQVLNKVLKTAQIKTDFLSAYIYFDSEDVIEMEMNAQNILGDMRHGLEQGLGALFIKKGIHPQYGKGGYFKSIRRPKNHGQTY